MGKVVLVSFKPATNNKPKRVEAKSDSALTVTEWNYDLTDSANYRLAVNEHLFEINSEPHNAIYRIKWHVIADAPMPTGTEHVYIIED